MFVCRKQHHNDAKEFIADVIKIIDSLQELLFNNLLKLVQDYCANNDVEAQKRLAGILHLKLRATPDLSEKLFDQLQSYASENTFSVYLDPHFENDRFPISIADHYVEERLLFLGMDLDENAFLLHSYWYKPKCEKHVYKNRSKAFWYAHYYAQTGTFKFI